MLTIFDRQIRWMATSAVVACLATGCDADVQTLRITAEDFRFTPSEIRAETAHPIRLILVNQGREPHEFESPLLAHRVDQPTGNATTVRLEPNQRIDVMIRTIPGTYLYYCRIRGHVGMTGTIIVE